MQTDSFARIVMSIRQKIVMNGHVIMGIGGGPCFMCGNEKHEHEIPFCYSVGMTGVGFPELVVFALQVRDGHRILDHLVKMMRRSQTALVHGQRISLGGRYPLLAVEADRPEVWTEFVTMPRRVYKREHYPVIQLLVPDTNGLYPPHCSPPYSNAPILCSRFPIGGH